MISKKLPDLFRHFPYISLSAQFFPLYAYLYVTGEIQSAVSLLMMAPFIFSHAAGFAYNNLVDRFDPQFKRNPIADGKISALQARWIIALCIMISAITFGLLYRSLAAWALYLIYLFLGAAYSGLGLRFKETLAGPFVAAFVIWTAGPLILALEFAQLSEQIVSGFIGAVCLIYLGREIYHTIIDRENDLRAGLRTFGTRTSSSTQRVMLLLALTAGGICLFWSVYNYFIGAPASESSTVMVILLAALILLAVLIETILPPSPSRLPPIDRIYPVQNDFYPIRSPDPGPAGVFRSTFGMGFPDGKS